MNFYDKVKESADYIRSKINAENAIAMILGSGLGGLVDSIENKEYISYMDIPNFPKSTVKGHEGRIVYGTIGDKKVIAMQGRFHYYEGYSMKEVAYPVYVLKLIGVHHLIITNSCGGIHESLQPGSLMLITDFINYMGDNPLIGINDERFGPRFPDMTEPYSLDFQEKAKEAAKDINLEYKEGIYAGFMGPYYETAAEIQAFKIQGADAVGMSTVPETIVSNYLGMKTLGISCITNMATGIQQKKHSHEHVVKVANEASLTFCKWLERIVEIL